MNNIDAQIHHRPATREPFVRPPGLGPHHETAVPSHFQERPKVFCPRQPHQFLVVRIEVEPVTDRQFDFGRPTGCEHRVAFGHRVGHRLFADHVLAGIRRGNRMQRVQPVGRDHIDDVDIVPLVRVLRQPVLLMFRTSEISPQIALGAHVMNWIRQAIPPSIA